MYKVVFENDNGKNYLFGVDNNTVADFDLGNGVSVNLGKSQGFTQIGDTINTMSVEGRTISVKGAVYSDIPKQKIALRNAVAPFNSGRLVFDDKYYIYVTVQDAPTFSPVKNNGKFTMRFYAPYPFFRELNEKTVHIGSIKPMFRFPINYSTPHKFGETSTNKYANVLNDGNVSVPFTAYITARGASTNVTLSNLTTFEKLTINKRLEAGETVKIYRDEKNVLRAELTNASCTSDAIQYIDEKSTLFSLNVGDNMIAATDDEGGTSLSVTFSFSPAVVAVYES